MKLRRHLLALFRRIALTVTLAGFASGVAGAATGEERSPFEVHAALVTNGPERLVEVQFAVPPAHHVYADQLSFELAGTNLPAALPRAEELTDKFSGSRRAVYGADFTVRVSLPSAATEPGSFRVTWQGCGESECFFPESREWTLRGDVLAAATAVAHGETNGGEFLQGFTVAARSSGYLKPAQLIALLDRASGPAVASELPTTRAGTLGVVTTLGAILLGGLALNLTPCVLPMIPINLALLGAGMKRSSRRRGFLLGAAYGGGMTLAYGSLGLAVVLTGAKFGTLQSSPWFNFGIAAVFVVLALALFDRLVLDLSRFQRRATPGGGQGGSVLGAATMGAVSALLAGACVAPVILSVLLLATTQYQQGNLGGLGLPFLLGLGMALPWPFAGAGLSFLPRPGAWMVRVKHAFGILILGFAGWYAWQGWQLARPADTGRVASRTAAADLRELRRVLAEARQQDRPVLVDFWAGWCKSCAALEHTTLRHPRVRARLEGVNFVRFRAEHLGDPALKPVLDEFGVLGLPTLVLLQPQRPVAAAAPASASVNP